MKTDLLLIIVLLLANIMALRFLYTKVKTTMVIKVVMTLAVLLLPVLGLVVFYLWISLFNRPRAVFSSTKISSRPL